jgi:hypothetical protein
MNLESPAYRQTVLIATGFLDGKSLDQKRIHFKEKSRCEKEEKERGVLQENDYFQSFILREEIINILVSHGLLLGSQLEYFRINILYMYQRRTLWYRETISFDAFLSNLRTFIETRFW